MIKLKTKDKYYILRKLIENDVNNGIDISYLIGKPLHYFNWSVLLEIFKKIDPEEYKYRFETK